VTFYSAQKGIWTVVIGGMLIFSLATLIGKLIGIKEGHNKNNPLGKLAMEGTKWMIACFPFGLWIVFGYKLRIKDFQKS